MKLLLDSNVLVWFVADRNKLTPRALAMIEDGENELFTSRTCIWELSAKASRKGIPLLGSSIRFLLDQVSKIGITVLELENRYILRSETLPHHHSDPFDRILIAQALEERLTILTSDTDIPLYAAPVVWK